MEVLEMIFYHPEKKCKDHTGREFPSIKAMCEFWNILPETFRRRMAVYGYPLEKALSMPLKSNSNILCYDHLGAEFRSKSQMCDHWKIERKLFDYRMSHGWSLEDALTKPKREQKKK